MKEFPKQLIGSDFQLLPYEAHHLPLLIRAMNDSAALMSEWVPWATQVMTIEEGRAFIATAQEGYKTGRDFKFGIFDLQCQKLMGSIGFHSRGYANAWNLAAEVGLWISLPENGRGLGTRVVKAAIQWAFRSWPFTRLVWRCDEENTKSHRIAEKAAFELEATFKHAERSHRGPWRSTRVYTRHRRPILTNLGSNKISLEPLKREDYKEAATTAATYMLEVAPMDKSNPSYPLDAKTSDQFLSEFNQSPATKEWGAIKHSSGTILGVVGWEYDHKTKKGRLHEIAIPSFYQKCGFGRKLFKFAKNSLQKKGCQTLTLHLTDRPQRVVEFYTYMGAIDNSTSKSCHKLVWQIK